MKCPSCGFEQADGLLECQKCQIIFSKWQGREARRIQQQSSGQTTKIICDKDLKNVIITKITTTDNPEKKEIPLTDEQYRQLMSLQLQGKSLEKAAEIVLGIPTKSTIVRSSDIIAKKDSESPNHFTVEIKTSEGSKKEIRLTNDQYAQFKSLIAQGKNWKETVKIIFDVTK